MNNRQQRPHNNGKKRGPESKFYTALLGRRVVVRELHTKSELTAVLVWVDRFTLGLRDLDGREFLLNKGAIATLGPAGLMGKQRNEHRRGAAPR